MIYLLVVPIDYRSPSKKACSLPNLSLTSWSTMENPRVALAYLNSQNFCLEPKNKKVVIVHRLLSLCYCLAQGSKHNRGTKYSQPIKETQKYLYAPNT